MLRTLTALQGHDYPPEANVRKELIDTVRRVIGPIATPDCIHWAPGLPKTRSGKIMSELPSPVVLSCPLPHSCQCCLKHPSLGVESCCHVLCFQALEVWYPSHIDCAPLAFTCCIHTWTT